LIERIASNKKIELLQGDPQSISPADPDGMMLKVKDHEERCVDGTFIFIGAEPRTNWLSVMKENHGFVLTGPDLTKAGFPGHGERAPFGHETSIPGIFAAGDVRSGSVKRVAGATGEGAAAVAEIHQYLSLNSEDKS